MTATKVESKMRGLASRFPSQAAGALAAQITLALSSFVLQVLAARQLGPAGLGTFALLFGGIVMATAITTGLIGDSLTVLDRRDQKIASALFRLGWLLITAFSLVGAAVVVVAGLPISTAVVFGVATASFLTADLVRRVLMADLRFWSIVLADAVGFLAIVTFLAVSSSIRPLTLDSFIAAIAVGSVVSIAVALTRIPRTGQRRRPRGWGDWRAVLGYGSWRAAQQFVRPTMLNLSRAIVLVAAGAAAVGVVEAARVFMAPAMLLVQGLGSYLFSSYAAHRELGPRVLLRRADRAASVMLVGAVIAAGAGALALPWLGPLMTDGRFELSMTAVLGWSCYAASCAAILPYGSLAATQGRQQWVLVIRLVDSALALALAWLLLIVGGVDPVWLPWILSIGSFIGGVLCRQLLLRPLARGSGGTT